MRTAYKVRAYPDPEQAARLGRTFGCVRLVWNKTLAARREAYHRRGERTSYKQTDAALGEFRRLLEYKARRAGRTLVAVDRFFPSSKTCSACGHLLAGLSLSTRAWTCPACRTRHDRDVNAAKNILAAGRAAARERPGNACGAGVRRQGTSLPQSAKKQETHPARSGIPFH